MSSVLLRKIFNDQSKACSQSSSVSCTVFALGAPTADTNSTRPSCSMKGKDQWYFLITQISLSHPGSRSSFCRLILATSSLHSGSLTFFFSLNFLFSCLLWQSLRTKDCHHAIFFPSPHPFNKTLRPVSLVIKSTKPLSGCWWRLYDGEKIITQRGGEKAFLCWGFVDLTALHDW